MVTTSDLDIINSFYLEDIKIVRDALDEKKKIIGIGLKDYLGLLEKDQKYDLRKDKAKLEELSSPQFLPQSRWPVSSHVSLSLAQQVAVNVALSENEGIFSINGPPGTGKTTLLRDIISQIITNRATILAGFNDPKDAFTNPVSLKVERYNYKIWELDSKLLGHEIVIASSNNTAVENISKEIPRLSEVEEFYGLSYFSNIANNDDKSEKSWGIGSAVLGNKKNRSIFFEKFWNKQPKIDKNNKIDDKYGLEYLLQNVKPKTDWLEDKKHFLATLGELERLKSELVKLEIAFKEIADFDNNKNQLLKRLKKVENEIEISEIRLENYEKTIAQNEETINHNKFLLEELKRLEPKWYIIFLEFFKQGTSYQKWSDKCSSILSGISTLFQENMKLKLKISELKTLIDKLTLKFLKYVSEKEELSSRSNRSYEYITFMEDKYSWSSEVADQNFWRSDDEEMMQLSSPWIHEELQDMRAKVFVASMQLHYSFIVNSSERVLNNMKVIKQVLGYEGRIPLSEESLKSLWGVFFLIIPTVSTTFASFGRLFSGLTSPESLGWLLIDEAGQAAPQEALGAIYRAKRTIIVGDPLQIPPVVTISESINNILLEDYNIEKTWSVLEESVQTLADRVNIYGTNIKNQWVGCPLRVHRRCLEPMFSVANKIAYDNLMFQATLQKNSKFDDMYPSSLWIDVLSNSFDGHWSKEEGEVVLKMLLRIVNEHRELPDLYIISPFKTVARNMAQLLRSNLTHKDINKGDIIKWVNRSVGTIHTFQGKQAEGVILILGGKPSTEGAINWASRYPNILNVALTRSKYKFFVVGNYKSWASKPHFKELAESLSRVSADDNADYIHY